MDNDNSRSEVPDCSDPTRPESSGGGARYKPMSPGQASDLEVGFFCLIAEKMIASRGNKICSGAEISRTQRDGEIENMDEETHAERHARTVALAQANGRLRFKPISKSVNASSKDCSKMVILHASNDNKTQVSYSLLKDLLFLQLFELLNKRVVNWGFVFK
ncbi:hypothetical protein OIU76_024175 [Salix suchowensis]|nr:hypothetical protein OIU76_024175 [Salix suchowensis]